VNVQHHPFFALTVDGAEWSALLSGQFPLVIPTEHMPGGPCSWSGCFREKKNLLLLPESTSDSSVVQAITVGCTD